MSSKVTVPITPEVVGKRSDAVFFARGDEAPVTEIRTIDGIDIGRPITAKTLLPGPKGSLLELHLPAGSSLPPRRYSHQGIWFLLKGGVGLKLGGREYVANPRAAWSCAPGTETAIVASQDSVILEWTSPPHIIHNSELLTWGEALPGSSHLFVNWDDVEPFLMTKMEGETVFGLPGLDVKHTLKVMVPGPYGSLLWNTHLKGKWALHTHHHHWIAYLISGKMKEKFGGDQEIIANAGDVWAAQAGAEHCTEALEDNELIEFKWPAPMLWRGLTHSWDPRGSAE